MLCRLSIAMDLSVSMTEYICLLLSCLVLLLFKCYLMLQCGQSVQNLWVSPIMALFIKAWPWKDNLPLNLAHFWILVQYAKSWPRTFGSIRSRRHSINWPTWKFAQEDLPVKTWNRLIAQNLPRRRRLIFFGVRPMTVELISSSAIICLSPPSLSSLWRF